MSKCVDCAYFEKNNKETNMITFHCPCEKLNLHENEDQNWALFYNMKTKKIGRDYEKDWDCPIFELRIGKKIKRSKKVFDPKNAKIFVDYPDEIGQIICNDLELNKIKMVDLREKK